MISLPRLRHAALAAGIAAITLTAACGTGSGDHGTSGHQTASPTPAANEHGGHGMDTGEMPAGDGLAAAASGFRLSLGKTTLAAGRPESLRFQIVGTGNRPVKNFELEQTQRMHFYLIRSDLSGFQHVHPKMASDGTWTATLSAAQPGSYRAYASFISKDAAGKPVSLVLGQRVSAPGKAVAVPVPPASTTTTVDGYALKIDGPALRAGSEQPLTMTVTRGGRPVTDLQPYLETYAHVTAFHQGDLAFAHLHPQGAVSGNGGPKLSFAAMLPKPGAWRLYIQFQTAGVLHTAPITLTAG